MAVVWAEAFADDESRVSRGVTMRDLFDLITLRDDERHAEAHALRVRLEEEFETTTIRNNFERKASRVIVLPLLFGVLPLSLVNLLVYPVGTSHAAIAVDILFVVMCLVCVLVVHKFQAQARVEHAELRAHFAARRSALTASATETARV